MQFGSYALDTRRHLLSTTETQIQLSPLAGRLLALLAQSPGEVVERGTIIEALWRGDWLVGDPALNRLVSELRRSVGDDPRNPTLVQTVPRQGYRLVVAPGGPETGSVPEPAGVPLWRQIWHMGNMTMAILFAGLSLILLLAIFAHN